MSKPGWLFVLLLITTIATQEAQAQYMQPMLNGGSSHYYAVLLDGEGDASVAAKLVIYNTADTPLEKFTFEIPGDGVRIINAVQEGRTRQHTCQQYSNECVKFAPSVNCMQYDGYDCINYERPCLERSNKCISMGLVDGPFGYQKMTYVSTPLSHSTALTFSLPSPIGPQQQSAVLLYYKAGPYAEESLGRFSYDFETIKVNDDISTVRVAISVPQEFVLDGAAGETEYRAGFAQFGSMEKAMASPSMQDEAMSSFSRQIEYQSGIVKTTQALDPLESFHVKGAYARGRWALYWEYIISGTALVLALITGFVVAGIRIARTSRHLPAWLVAIMTGVGNSFIICLLLFGGIVLAEFVSHGGYRWQFALPLLFIAWIALLFVAVFAPSIVVGMKKGAVWGIVAFSVMLVALVIIATLMAVMRINIWPPTIMY